MTKREALNGKPYAGNPHVRFDEGEAASTATSRRGSLLYKATLPRTLTAVMLAVSCQLSAGVTATWTGAQDAYWTNAANWLVNGDVPERCPGVVEPSDGSDPAMPTGDIAIFDSNGGNGRTTIDLDGLYSVLEVRVQGADCPRYTFGTSTSQRLVFERTWAGGVEGMTAWSGKFKVAAEVPADSAPVVNATVYTGNFDFSWCGKSGFGTVFDVINDSQGTVVFNSSIANQRRRPGSVDTYAEVTVAFRGSGNLEFNAPQVYDGKWLVTYGYYLTGKIMINDEFIAQKRVKAYASCKVVLAENAVYGTYFGNSVGFEVHNGSTLTVEGEGTMRLVENESGKTFENHGFNTPNDGYIDVYSRLKCYGSKVILDSSKTSAEKRALRLYGPPAYFDKGGFIFHKCPHLAVKSTNSLGNCRSFTVTNGLDASSSAFMWEGSTAGEALTIPINYIGAESSVFTVQNNGSAPFTVSSAVTVPDGSKQLVLKGNTAPLILAPTLSEDIKLGLAGEIVLPESTSLENVSSVTIAADTCLTVEGAAERTLPHVSVTGGESEIIFTDDAQLSFSGLTVSGGTLNIKVGDSGASVVFKDTASAGTSPSGLLLDGYPASISSDGTLVVNPMAVDNEIAARGSVVPDSAGATVGITSAGSGEADVLKSETTTVKALVQQTSTAAVVAIEAGQTLAADEVAIDHGFGSLTVGNVAGRGALGSAESPLILRNDSPVATLSVNAKIVSPDVTRSGIGDIVLTGGMTPVMDSMSLSAGETCINGGTWNTSTSTCVTVRDGAVLTVGGDARLLSNAGTSWVEKTVANIDVTDGILKIEDDAVITNRITLNRSVSGKISAIYQSGGTVYEQGTGSTFHVFARASQGYWDLSGGKLDFVGQVGIGEEDSIASIRQSGGEIYSAASAFRVGAGQCAMAEFVMTGGTGNFASMNIRDWGYYPGARGTVTIDGPAYMEVRAAAHMASENGENLSSFTCSMLNLAGGVFSANVACRGGNNGGVKSRDMSKGYVNFNGGTYRTRANTGGVGGRGLFGHAIGGTGNNNTWVDYVTIYSGGATIETDEPQRTVYIHTPLRAPVGKGVASVDFSAYRGKRTGLTAPPAVVIDGDGEGASAYAVFDVETGSITGVRVVSPGWGYTTATARFYSGNVNNFSVCPVTLADAVSGGLTKAGSGSLYLNAENTYTGETVLKGGALHLVCSGALPAESTVAYEGGELRSTAAAFPSAIKVRIPGAENGSVRRCDLATFTDSCPDALPEVEVVNVPENVKPRWVAGFRGLILYVKRFAGSVISFR